MQPLIKVISYKGMQKEFARIATALEALLSAYTLSLREQGIFVPPCEPVKDAATEITYFDPLEAELDAIKKELGQPTEDEDV